MSRQWWPLTVGALLAATLTSASPGLAAHPEGQHRTSPRGQSIGYTSLQGVSAVSATRAFAVGKFGLESSALTQEWNGAAWSRRTSSAGNHSVLSAVDSLSTSEAWAVGWWTRDDSGTGQHPLAERWDGHRWRVVDAGSQGQEQRTLLGVSMVSANDVWAVGAEQVDEERSNTLILHWDGHMWSQVPSPSPDGFVNYLESVTAVSADDAWAVGQGGGVLMLHWDGATWAKVDTPSAPDTELRSLSAVSSNDVWAVGDRYSSTVVEHWDGSSWSAVGTPDPALSGRLMSVSAASAHDLWAVGWTYGSSSDGYPGRALILHGDGRRWKVVDSPHPGQDFDSLTAVSADSARDAWAVGMFGPDTGYHTGKIMMLHWDGATWTRYHHP